ncbi:hypothetical protein SFUL_1124 [Streptomyces microflavus DSM 40593]|uniref:Uncharacterized protein n=1 Tax=Streptomyces microflavus DSM 40593 TaxID=1303692 RepID=N0CST0_STRMI|nr:hypothetical protein SFUL_1124 [Streptomyces microflavus DSM 40593]
MPRRHREPRRHPAPHPHRLPHRHGPPRRPRAPPRRPPPHPYHRTRRPPRPRRRPHRPAPYRRRPRPPPPRTPRTPVPGRPPPSPPGAGPWGPSDLTPAPGAAPPPPGAYRVPARYGYPETPAETTTRLRPVPPRQRWRGAAAAACVVLGLGLIGGAATGAWLTGDSSAEPTRTPYTAGRTVWHSVPVDTLFPRTLKGTGAGPGGTNRNWTRLAVAADSDCSKGLDPLLRTTLRSVGCERMVRATYTDATRSAVTTVGMVVTETDAAGMQALSTRFAEQKLAARKDLMPRTYAPEGTLAAGFGDRQRASWTVRPLTEIPVVVFAVSGFADARTVDEPQPAEAALETPATTDIAQAGLGHEAKGIADRVERGVRTTVTDLVEPPE